MITATQQPPSKFKGKQMPVVMVPLSLFSDDLSGNKSKKTNSFDVWAMTLAGLPRKENAKLANIHFIAASNKVTALNMAEPIVNDLLKLEEGVIMYDAAMQRDVCVVAPVLCILADNVRASELASHCGCTANKYCRMCEVCYYRRAFIMYFPIIVHSNK